MGIDKPNVRFVIHYSLPKSIEGYYQESGRAGRDGDLAVCILYYTYADMIRHLKLIECNRTNSNEEAKQMHINNLYKIMGYCENVIDCRRIIQLNYFGEAFQRNECLMDRQSMCDNCMNSCSQETSYKIIDTTAICLKIAIAVRNLCSGSQRFTLLHMADVFYGSKIKKIVDNQHDQSEYFGIMKDWVKNDIQRLLHKMVLDEFLHEELFCMNDIPQVYLRVGQNIDELVKNKIKIDFAIKNNIINSTKNSKYSIRTNVINGNSNGKRPSTWLITKRAKEARTK